MKRIIPKYLVVIIFFLAIVVVSPMLSAPHRPVDAGFDEASPGGSDLSGQTEANSPETQGPGDTVVNIDPADGPEKTDGNTANPGSEPGAEPGGEHSPEPDPEPAPMAPPVPYAVEGTEPERLLVSFDIMAGGAIVESYISPARIDFAHGGSYSLIEGVTAFRGNNYRDAPSYGVANIHEQKFGAKWTRNTGSLTAPDGTTWTGHGWTGQPLIVKWPMETREIMNMHSWAKSQDELVEVIYAAMDGNVYFAELETGKATRDRLNIGYTFKGSGSVDPRGYPLLYVGAGYTSNRGYARIFIISLVDGSVLHTFGLGDGFAPRNWTAADASPLIDAENDKLIYPSENGVLYIIDLNSEFNVKEGTVKIDPSAPVMWRFKGARTNSGGGFWAGMEASPAIWGGYLYIADNGGHLVCLDLNTLTPVWAQDVLDDTNNSPVIEVEDGWPYIYISTGFHGGWRAPGGGSAPVPIWKFDAITGEIIWQTDYTCFTTAGVSGGVQGTIAIGKDSLGDLIFVPVARTPTRSEGILAALDKSTGEVVWEFRTTTYSWSSPVCVYTPDGKGYIVHTNAAGNIYLLDGLTGELLDSAPLGGTIEASPAVYGSTVVVGTRASLIWGIALT